MGLFYRRKTDSKKIKRSNKLTKKIITYLFGIISFILVFGVTYAAFDFQFLGDFNLLGSNEIKIEFLESSNIIDVENVFPIPDDLGISESKPFAFEVKTTTKNNMNLKYRLAIETLEVTDGYTKFRDDQIKVYLTDYEDNPLVGPVKVSELNDVLYTKINNHDETNQVNANKYKIRVWVDHDVDASNWDENTKLEYRFIINVNANKMDVYEVLFYSNYGTRDVLMQLIEFDKETKLDKNTYSREGYTFKGWSTSTTGGVVYQDQQVVKNLVGEFSGNKSFPLYAVWEINKYDVEMIVNSGSSSESSKIVTHGSSTTFNVSSSDNNMKGTVSCTNGQSAILNGDTLTLSSVTNNTVCTLTYNYDTFQVTLNGNGATNNGTNSLTTTYNSSSITPSTLNLPSLDYIVSFDANNTSATISSIANVKSSYTFDGWYSEATEGVKILSNAKSPIFEKGVSGYTDVDGKWIRTSDTTLYAKWSSNSVKLPTLSKTGNTCEWNTNADGSGTSYSSGDTITPTKHMKLYAVCVANVYSITLNNQSATTAGTSKIYFQYNTTKVINGVNCNYFTNSTLTTCVSNNKISKPAKTGYSFRGYYTSTSGGGTQYINLSGSFVNNLYKTVGNKTLYAYWVDDVAPTITMTSSSGGNWTKDRVDITVNASDKGQGIKNIQFSYDNETWTTRTNFDSGSTDTDVIYTPYFESENNIVFYVRATDNAGNISGVKKTNIKIDKTAPTLTISNSSGGSWTNDRIDVDVTSSDVYSGVKNIQFSYDNETWTTRTNFESGSTLNKAIYKPYFESAQNKVFYLKTTDNVGNVSTVKSTNIKIDKTKPSCTLYARTDNYYSSGGTKAYTAGSNSHGVYLDLVCSDSASGLKSQQIDKGGTKYATEQYLVNTVARSGCYNYTAVDKAGNTATGTCINVVVIPAAPTCSVAKSNLNTTSGVTLTVSSSTATQYKFGSDAYSTTKTKSGVKATTTVTVKDSYGQTGTCKATVSNKTQYRYRTRSATAMAGYYTSGYCAGAASGTFYQDTSNTTYYYTKTIYTGSCVYDWANKKAFTTGVFDGVVTASQAIPYPKYSNVTCDSSYAGKYSYSYAQCISCVYGNYDDGCSNHAHNGCDQWSYNRWQCQCVSYSNYSSSSDVATSCSASGSSGSSQTYVTCSQNVKVYKCYSLGSWSYSGYSDSKTSTSYFSSSSPSTVKTEHYDTRTVYY